MLTDRGTLGHRKHVYSPLLEHVAISDLVRYPRRSSGQPKRDLADVLSTRLILDAARKEFGGELICRAAKAWSVHGGSAAREIAKYSEGVRGISKERVALLRPSKGLGAIVKLPWEPLHPWRLSAYPVYEDTAESGVDAKQFWWSLCGWRRSLEGRQVRTLLEWTENLLAHIAPMARSSMMRSYTVEFIDVIDRLLDLLPAEILPLWISVDPRSIGLFEQEEGLSLLSDRGLKPQRIIGRWRHLRWLQSRYLPRRQLAIGVSREPVEPWYFMRAATRETVMSRPRNKHIDLADRVAAC